MNFNLADIDGPPPLKCNNSDKNKKIFLQKIPPNTTDQQLFDLFNQFGELVYAYSIKRKKETSGYGFAKFKSAECAQKVLKVRDFSINGGHLILESFKGGISRTTRTPRRNLNTSLPPPVPPKLFIYSKRGRGLKDLVCKGVDYDHNIDNLKIRLS